MKENRIRKTLDASRSSGVYHKLAGHGVAPGAIKAAIIEVLEPYFEHRDLLVEHAVRYLGNEAMNVLRFRDDRSSIETMRGAIAIYRRAKTSHPDRCFEIIGDWQAAVLKGLSDYWSQYQLETNTDRLELEEFAIETGRMIGGLIESTIQPLIRELVAQVELAEGRDSTLAALRVVNFGGCISKLRDAGVLPDACSPPPWAIPLNQWRNMAQHHDFEVRNGAIVGTYGPETNRRTITLTRGEMLEAAIRFSRLYGALNVARSIFFFDNLEAVHKALPVIPLRTDTQALQLATSFATQGFVLEDLAIDEQAARVVVSDATDGPTLTRSIHSSQFLFVIWQSFPRDALSVEFRSRDGSVVARFGSEGEVCQAISDGTCDPDVLPETMAIVMLRGALSGDPSE